MSDEQKIEQKMTELKINIQCDPLRLSTVLTLAQGWYASNAAKDGKRFPCEQIIDDADHLLTVFADRIVSEAVKRGEPIPATTDGVGIPITIPAMEIQIGEDEENPSDALSDQPPKIDYPNGKDPIDPGIKPQTGPQAVKMDAAKIQPEDVPHGTAQTDPQSSESSPTVSEGDATETQTPESGTAEAGSETISEEKTGS